jgi:hypothetical protein
MKFEIHFEFRASLRKFQNLNFWDATGGERTARAHGEGAGARRVTKSERRGRRKEKTRGPFISPLCRVPAIWHSTKTALPSVS